MLAPRLHISPAGLDSAHDSGVLVRSRHLAPHSVEVIWCALLPEDRPNYPKALEVLAHAYEKQPLEGTHLLERASHWFAILQDARRNQTLPEHCATVLLDFDMRSGAASWVNASGGTIWSLSGPGASPQPHAPQQGPRLVPAAVPSIEDNCHVAPGGWLLLPPPDHKSIAEETIRRLLVEAAARHAPGHLICAAWRSLGNDPSHVPDAVVMQPERPTHPEEALLQITLTRYCDQLAPLRQGIATLCADMPEEFVQMLMLATYEAATNVVKHARPVPGDNSLHAILRREGPQASVELIYAGEPFCPKEDSTPDFSGATEGGFGLFIIQQAVDDVVYERYLPGLAVIRLTKRLSA